MALRNFQDLVTVVYAEWLNKVDVLLDTVFNGAASKAAARTALEVTSSADFLDTSDVAKNDALIAGKRTDTGAVAFDIHQFNENRPIDVLTDFIPSNLRSGIKDGSNTTDLYSYIQSAIDAAGLYHGTGLFFTHGVWRYATLLNVANPNILLLGDGQERSHNVGSQNTFASTRFLWAGAAGGTMIDFNSPTGASAQKMLGGGINGIDLHANGAGYGIKVRSWNNAVFQNLFLIEFSTACIYTDVVTQLGEERTTQRNTFRNISSRCITNSGTFAHLAGDATYNTSFNIFENIDVVHNNGHAFDLYNTDNNLFLSCRIFRNGGGTGNAVVFNGSNSTLAEVARHNVFSHFSCNAPIIGRGTSTFTHASYDNSVLLADISNATPDPTIETGSSVHFTTTENVHYKPSLKQAAIGDTLSNAKTARTNLASTESVRIRNGSTDHIVIEDASGNTWRVNISGTTLRVYSASSTDELQLLNSSSQGLKIVGKVGFYNTAPQSKPTITGSRAGNAALADLLTELATLGLIVDSSSA